MKKEPISEDYDFEDLARAVSLAVVLISILLFLIVVFTLISLNIALPEI